MAEKEQFYQQVGWTEEAPVEEGEPDSVFHDYRFNLLERRVRVLENRIR